MIGADAPRTDGGSGGSTSDDPYGGSDPATGGSSNNDEEDDEEKEVSPTIVQQPPQLREQNQGGETAKEGTARDDDGEQGIRDQKQGGNTAQEGSARDNGEQVIESDHTDDQPEGYDNWREVETDQRQDLDSHNENTDYTGPDTGINSSNAPEQDGSPYQGGHREDDGGSTDPSDGTWSDPDGHQGDSDEETDGLIGNDGENDPDNPDNDGWGWGDDSAGDDPSFPGFDGENGDGDGNGKVEWPSFEWPPDWMPDISIPWWVPMAVIATVGTLVAAVMLALLRPYVSALSAGYSAVSGGSDD